MSVTKETFLSDVVAQSPRSSMAPSSNSELKCASYDVFLSFRGSDTRKGFTDHLYAASKREGFQTFRDDDGIERGENIRSELRKAIWNSRMSIIVFSKNYLNSTTCLFEIQTILEHRKEKSDHVILPVFYEVDSLEIKEQAKNLDSGEDKVRVAEVLSIAGMDSQNQSNGYEAKFIEDIVGEIKRKLHGKHLWVADHPVSMESRSKLPGKHLGVADHLGSEGITGKKYKLLDEISERTIRWTIKVKVVNIMGPLPSKDGKATYKRYILLDEKGKKIHATVFGKEIETFDDTLELHKTYLISRALLTKVDTKHKRSPDEHACQITLKYFSIIQEAENEGINPEETEFSFIPLCDIPALQSMAPQIDIVAIVMGISQEENRKRKRDLQDITFRNIILIDSSLQTTTLTTWGSFIHDECDKLANMLDKRPIIVATNLQLKDVDGKRYISTSQFSEILINLQIREVKQLEAWKLENENILKSISSESGSSSTSSMNTIQEIRYTADIGSTYHVKASVTTILQQEQCWYNACNSCHKKTDQQIGMTFECTSCSKPNVTAEPWPCVRVELGDSTGHLPATLFGTHAEKILACEANQLIARDIEEQLTMLEKWMNERMWIDYIFHVRLAQRRDARYLEIIKVKDAK